MLFGGIVLQKKINSLFFRLILISLIVAGGLFSSRAPVYGGDDPFTISGSYSLQEQAQIQGNYQFNQNFAVDFGYQRVGQYLSGNRWQGRMVFTPVTGLDLKTGYDFTEKNFLLGLDTQLPLGRNLRLVSDLETLFSGAEGRNFLDYYCGLMIGIGIEHYIVAGARGLYEFGIPSEPELFLQLDLNWYLPKDFKIRFQPLVGVEGEFCHQTTLLKKWENGLETGVYVGQKEDHSWNFGVMASY